MTLAGAAIAGAIVGLGVLLIYRALRPKPPPLAQVLAELESRPTTETQGTDPRSLQWLSAASLRLLDAAGLTNSDSLRQQLRALDKPPERHAFDKLAGAVAGFLLPIGFAALLAAAGIDISVGLILLVAVALAAMGFFYPDIGLADKVEQRRRSFRHALSAYLDLVTVILAGGGGLETALQAAANSGDGWAFSEIRGALQKARVSNRTPWETFDELGEELGVDELRELAASAQLAGSQGARIRASLAAKADSMRTHQTASIEAQGEAATEKMLLPVVALVVGMILFIGFGVVQAITIATESTLPP